MVWEYGVGITKISFNGCGAILYKYPKGTQIPKHKHSDDTLKAKKSANGIVNSSTLIAMSWCETVPVNTTRNQHSRLVRRADKARKGLNLEHVVQGSERKHTPFAVADHRGQSIIDACPANPTQHR